MNFDKLISKGALLPISGFVLDEKFQRNASKFAIFYIYENPKLLFPFFISCYFIFFPNECLGLCFGVKNTLKNYEFVLDLYYKTEL